MYNVKSEIQVEIRNIGITLTFVKVQSYCHNVCSIHARTHMQLYFFIPAKTRLLSSDFLYKNNICWRKNITHTTKAILTDAKYVNRKGELKSSFVKVSWPTGGSMNK